YPLLVSVNTAIDDIYADWRKDAWRIGLLLLALSIATIGLTSFWAREWRRRAERQSELATLATTDPLTGLCNRRRFDEVIASERLRIRHRRAPRDAEHRPRLHTPGTQVLAPRPGRRSRSGALRSETERPRPDPVPDTLADGCPLARFDARSRHAGTAGRLISRW